MTVLRSQSSGHTALYLSHLLLIFGLTGRGCWSSDHYRKAGFINIAMRKYFYKVHFFKLISLVHFWHIQWHHSSQRTCTCTWYTLLLFFPVPLLSLHIFFPSLYIAFCFYYFLKNDFNGWTSPSLVGCFPSSSFKQ